LQYGKVSNTDVLDDWFTLLEELAKRNPPSLPNCNTTKIQLHTTESFEQETCQNDPKQFSSIFRLVGDEVLG
jgi:hypothetical protein